MNSLILPPPVSFDPCSPSTTGAELLDQVPTALVRAIGRLPHRLVFQNESLSLLLAGLEAGQELHSFEPNCELLMVVAHGRLWLNDGGNSRWLEEGGEIYLSPPCAYDMRALEQVDLLFLSPSARAAEARRCSRGLSVNRPALKEGRLLAFAR